MRKRKPLTNEEGEVRELELADFRAARPAKDVLPPDLYTALVKESEKRRVGQRGPGKRPAKVTMSFRFDSDLAESIKDTGAGYSRRVADVLRKAFRRGAAVKTKNPARRASKSHRRAR